MTDTTNVTPEAAREFIYGKYPHLKLPIEGPNPVVDFELDTLSKWMAEFTQNHINEHIAPMLKQKDCEINGIQEQLEGYINAHGILIKHRHQLADSGLDLKEELDKAIVILDETFAAVTTIWPVPGELKTKINNFLKENGKRK